MSRETQDDRKAGVIYVSPSQMKTFDDCERKWGYRYIDGIKSPSKPEQEFGKLGHSRNEAWLENGDFVGDDDVGLVCQQGIKKGYMPTPGPELLIEQKLEVPVFSGKARVIGYIDCVLPPNPEGRSAESKLPIVHDWKFTKDLRWAMSVADLDDDFQVAIYGKAALLAYPEATHVIARWIYFCGRPNKKAEDGRPRTPRGVRRVQQMYSREQIEVLWGKAMKVARQIIKTRADYTEAKDVPANPLHCDAYGGCAHREYCPLPESLGLGAALTQYNKTHQHAGGDTPMADQDLLSQLTQGASAPATPAAETGADILAQMQANHGAGETVNPPPDPPKQEAASGDDPLATLLGAGGGESSTKAEEEESTSPEAAASDANDAIAALLGGGGKAKVVVPKTDKPPETLPPAAETKAEGAAPPATDAKPKEPKKRKSTSKARKGSSFIAALDVGIIKGIDGLGDVTHLSTLLEPLTTYLAANYKKHRNGEEWPDGIGHWGLIPFGEGKAILSKNLDAYFDKHGFKGVLVVDTTTAEGNAVLDVVLRRADVVIRPTR